MVRAVSCIDSPFITLLVETEKLTKSALNLLAASAKEVFVLVDGSKKRLTTDLPLSGGTFFISLLRTSLKPEAVSRM
jgi:hypothetical protein